MTLLDISNAVNNGCLSVMTIEAITLMNNIAMDIIRKDSLLAITQEDVNNLNLLIDISNVLKVRITYA